MNHLVLYSLCSILLLSLPNTTFTMRHKKKATPVYTSRQSTQPPTNTVLFFSGSKAQLEELIKTSGKPTIVEFFTHSCGHCKGVRSFYQNLARRFPEITFLAVDIDEAPELKKAYVTIGVPTFVCFPHNDLTQTETLLGPQRKKLELRCREYAQKIPLKPCINTAIRDKKNV